MRSALALASALFVAVLLALAPFASTSGGAAAVRSEAGAYGMRLCELALWSGTGATSDRMLEPRAGQAVPYGSFASSATAFVLARALPREKLDVQDGELDEDALADGAARLFLVLGWIAALALALAGASFARGAERGARAHSFLVGVPAALAWTLIALVPASDGGAARAPAWTLLLSASVLWGAAQLARRRDLVDQLPIAIGVGGLGGLAWLAEPFAWPALLAPALALGLSARGADREARRDALRCAIFFGVTLLAVARLSAPWPAGATPWPRFEPGWELRTGVVADPCITVACVLLVAWLSRASKDNVASRALCLALAAGTLLRAIDPRFAPAPLAPAGVAFVLWTSAVWRAPRGSILRPVLALGAAAAGTFVAFTSMRATLSTESVAALRELRASTPSSGAWNHPAAPQSYGILADPRDAGSVAFHARRPICGGLLPGADATPTARAAARALLSDSVEELVQRADELLASYVIVTARGMASVDGLRELAADSAASGASEPWAARLLSSETLPGLELVSRVPSMLSEEAGAEIAIWRIARNASKLPPAEMRAR